MGWDEVRDQVARALSAMQARECALRGTSTTLEVALLEAVVDLDSDQSDAVATLGEGNLVQYSDDGKVRPGQLQRLTQLESTFFGDSATGAKGLLDAMRDMPDPNAADEDV